MASAEPGAFASGVTRYRRRASHAGSWYTSQPSTLNAQLEGWLATAAVSRTAASARAIIAPHAGYSFSGPTAAHAYGHLRHAAAVAASAAGQVRPRRVFVLGPSHHVYLEGCAVSMASACDAVLGDLVVDTEVVESLLATGHFQQTTSNVDEDEHSIEMHLPYITRAMETDPSSDPTDAHNPGTFGEGFSVVCIMVGQVNDQQQALYGSILAPYLEVGGC